MLFKAFTLKKQPVPGRGLTAVCVVTVPGWVVGSLEILGSPASLVRSIGNGVSDFFRLPYEGLTRGPGAFVSGVSRGTTSFVKHISKGVALSRLSTHTTLTYFSQAHFLLVGREYCAQVLFLSLL